MKFIGCGSHVQLGYVTIFFLLGWESWKGLEAINAFRVESECPKFLFEIYCQESKRYIGVIMSLNPTSVKRRGDLVYLTTERNPKVNFSYHFWMRAQFISNGIRVQPSLLRMGHKGHGYMTTSYLWGKGVMGPCVQDNMDVYASKWLCGLCASNTGKAYPWVDLWFPLGEDAKV